jgi:hypothetical protein
MIVETMIAHVVVVVVEIEIEIRVPASKLLQYYLKLIMMIMKEV